jgi:hypothetical protein
MFNLRGAFSCSEGAEGCRNFLISGGSISTTFRLAARFCWSTRACVDVKRRATARISEKAELKTGLFLILVSKARRRFGKCIAAPAALWVPREPNNRGLTSIIIRFTSWDKD